MVGKADHPIRLVVVLTKVVTVVVVVVVCLAVVVSIPSMVRKTDQPHPPLWSEY